MSLTSLIEQLLGPLFDQKAPAAAGNTEDPTFLNKVIETVVDATEPRLRLLPGYADELAAAVRRALSFMRSVAGEFPGAFPLSPSQWNSDPRTNAFFATPDDVRRVLRDSEALHDFFEAPANVTVDSAYALLLMEKTEKRSLGVAAEGDVLHREVPRLTLSFSHHTLMTPAATLDEERRAVGLRIFQTLADIAMENILARRAEARDLGEEKALLETRLRQARTRSTSFIALCDDGRNCLDPAALEAELAQIESRLTPLRARLSTLEDALHAISEVIGDPGQHLGLRHTHLWVDRLGVVQTEPGHGPVNELHLTEGDVQLKGRLRHYVLAIARCERHDMPPRPTLQLPAVW